MTQETTQITHESLSKAVHAARKGGQRAARTLSEGQRLLSLAMLDKGRPAKPAVDRAFVQHGICL
jgi:hypothetical protein